ncbi:PAC4 domain-containing protein [Phanerochaete sordida]|uniref:PAC4 domain-containing protein n=1 Tax=Phanerochaete sordida TaxID=48140 RepID=A0A9P3GL65_9APHY|nr:PAC4 domain-containing protein [Phanerochaete sordida]
MSDTADTETRQPSVSVHARFVPPAEPSLPPLALQVTRLVGSYMLAPLRGSLTRDWTCAMPPTSISAGPGAATTLHRSSSSDVSFSMAQRLARRFRKQIFLSVDVPPSFMALGDGPRLVLAVEKAVVGTLKSLEETGQVPAS